MQTFRLREIFEPMCSKVEERYVARQAVTHDALDEVGQHDLATVDDRNDPCDPIERRTEVIAVAFVRYAAV